MTLKLRGQVGRGMFPNEVSFVVTDHNGNSYVILLPREMVDESNGSPTITVNLIGREGDVALVRVPGEPFDSNLVSVHESELVPA